MKRTGCFLLLGVAALLGGCVTPTRASLSFAVPTPVVAHVHGPECGHHWGWYAGYPVYYDGALYTYWDGYTWIHVGQPPVHVHRYYAAPRTHYHVYTPAPRVHRHYRTPATPRYGHTPRPHGAYPRSGQREHRATPVR